MSAYGVLSAADASVIVGLVTLAGVVLTAILSGKTKKAVNGELHDRLERMENNQDRIEAKVDAIVHEVAGEKVRAQMAEAEILARLEQRH